jgi:hypothetical protein
MTTDFVYDTPPHRDIIDLTNDDLISEEDAVSYFIDRTPQINNLTQTHWELLFEDEDSNTTHIVPLDQEDSDDEYQNTNIPDFVVRHLEETGEILEDFTLSTYNRNIDISEDNTLPTTSQIITIDDETDDDTDDNNDENESDNEDYDSDDNSITETEEYQLERNFGPRNTMFKYERTLKKFGLDPSEQPIGLFTFAVSNQLMGDYYNNYNEDLKSEPYYKMVEKINPYNVPCYMDLACIQETKHNNYPEAERYYFLAIEQGKDQIVLFNLATMYHGLYDHKNRSCKGLSISRSELAEHIIKYYDMASNYGDVISKELLCVFSYQSNNIKTFAKHFSTIVDEQWPLNVQDYKERRDDLLNHDFRMQYIKWAEDVGIIEIHTKLTEYIENNPDQTDDNNMKTILSKINSNHYVMSYKNKITLFTRLNNITECEICYETKLNIDFTCGHTVCTDCYKKIYRKSCPFCRIPFN